MQRDNFLSYGSLPREGYADAFRDSLVERIEQNRFAYVQVEESPHSELLINHLELARQGRYGRDMNDSQMAVLSGHALFTDKPSQKAVNEALKQLDGINGDSNSLIAINMEGVSMTGNGSQEVVRRVVEAANDKNGPAFVFVGSRPWERANETAPIELLEDITQGPEVRAIKVEDLASEEISFLEESYGAGEEELPIIDIELQRAASVVNMIRLGAVVDKSGVSIRYIDSPEEAAFLPKPVLPKGLRKPAKETSRSASTRLSITEETFAQIVPRPRGEIRLGIPGQSNRMQD